MVYCTHTKKKEKKNDDGLVQENIKRCLLEQKKIQIELSLLLKISVPFETFHTVKKQHKV